MILPSGKLPKQCEMRCVYSSSFILCLTFIISKQVNTYALLFVFLCVRGFQDLALMPLPIVWKDFTFKESSEAVRNEVRIFSFIHFIFILHYFATSNTNALLFVFLCVRIFQDFGKAFTLQKF